MKKRTCKVCVVGMSLLVLLFVFATVSHAAPPNAGQITQRQVQIIEKPGTGAISKGFQAYGPVTRVKELPQFCAEGYKYVPTSPIGPGLPPPQSVCDEFLMPCAGWLNNTTPPSPILGGFICRGEGKPDPSSEEAQKICFAGAQAIGGGDYGGSDANGNWKKLGTDICCAFIGDPGQDCK